MTVLEHTNMNSKQEKKDIVNVSMAPHPFAIERINSKVIVGKTIEQIIEEIHPTGELQTYAHIYIDGEYIEQKNWHLVKPKAGTIVTIRMIPQGGGGGGGKKNPLRTILSIAVMAGTGYLAGVVAGGLGSATFMELNVSGLAVSGVNLLGRLVLNAIAPPSSSKLNTSSESATLFIQGAKNQAKPFARVPKVLGKHRFVPPFGALPYTELVGDDQYLRMLFVWGYGPLNISELKIGETPIEEFDEVEIETRQGYINDNALTLYTNSVLQDDMQIYLKQEDGYILRTTEEDADEISIDITMPKGLVEFVGSDKKNASVSVEVQYAVHNSENWIDAETIDITAQQSSAVRKGLRFKVEQGKYDVRVKRVTQDNESNDNLFDDTVWTALRTIRYEDPINKRGLAVTALRIKATDQLNGIIDKLNGVVEAIIPDWDSASGEWVERATSNPASIYRHVLQGSANARPIEDIRIDIDKIQAWHESCTANNREFNTVIDYNISVREVCADVASAGRASPSLVDGKWSIIEDKVCTVPVQHFTPRNTFGFKGEKSFDDLPHGLRVRFINREKGWQQDERLVFDDGYSQETASKYESLEFNGVTDPEQIWRDGRYHLATARLRPETYSFYTDIEHIVCTRGDLIRFTHDVPVFGLMSARIKEVTDTGVILDSEIEMEADKSYSLRIRKSDGESVVADLVTITGVSNELLFVNNVADISAGELVMFGEQGQESVPLIVKSIRPQGELKAQITCVAYNENIFNADSENIPEFISYVREDSAFERLPTPKLKAVQSGLETVIKHSDGSLTSRVVITLDTPDNIAYPLNISAKIKSSDESSYRNATIMFRNSSEISIADIAEGQTYDIQLRYVDNSGAMSAPLTISNYRVEGTTALPSDVKTLELNVLGDNLYLSWEAVADIDLSHYVLRYSSKISDTTWGSAVDLVSKISSGTTSITVPAMSGSYFLKAVDVLGQESSNAIMAVSNIGSLSAFNAVEELIEDNNFLGEKDNVTLSDNKLVLTGADTIADWVDIDNVINIDIGENGVEPEGVYYFNSDLDLGNVYTSRVTAELNVVGSDIYDIIDSYNKIDKLESWDNSFSPSLFDIKLQISTSDDNVIWSEWKNFVIGDYKARAFKFRVLLFSKSPTVVPEISKLRVKIDMPDRIEAGDDIVAIEGNNEVDFTNAFRAKPTIAISAQNMLSGDYYSLTNTDNTGFNISFYDASDNLVSRSFDYLAKGYGLATN